MINRSAARPAQVETVTPTQAASYYEQRFTDQMRANVPRSDSSWSAEQQRLGSWNTGQGQLSEPGLGRPYSNGIGRPAWTLDTEEQR